MILQALADDHPHSLQLIFYRIGLVGLIHHHRCGSTPTDQRQHFINHAPRLLLDAIRDHLQIVRRRQREGSGAIGRQAIVIYREIERDGCVASLYSYLEIMERP